MENASRAILIASGILIAMLVVSLGIFAFSRLRSYQDTQDKAIRNEQIAEFNKPFETYNKSVVTGYEMVSLAHLAVDTNARNKLIDENYDNIEIKVQVNKQHDSIPNRYGVKRDFNLLEYIELYDRLTDNSLKKDFKDLYFQCTDIKNDSNTGRISEMKFSEITPR